MRQRGNNYFLPLDEDKSLTKNWYRLADCRTSFVTNTELTNSEECMDATCFIIHNLRILIPEETES